MLSIDEARKILNKEANNYNDEEIRIVLEFLYQLAEESFNEYSKTTDDEAGNNLHEGFYR